MLLLRAKRRKGGGGVTSQQSAAVLEVGWESGPQSHVESVRDGAAEPQSPGPCSSGAAVSETLQPPHQSLWGTEELERVQWRCMFWFGFLSCSLGGGGGGQEEKNRGRKTMMKR